ncbi:MAG: hypothetical protein WCS42_04550 [Verrucomicrobiota bacterium]
MFEYLDTVLTVPYQKAKQQNGDFLPREISCSVFLVGANAKELEKPRHDVKPRVVENRFARRFTDADAQAQKMPSPITIRKEYRDVALSSEFDSGKAGGKSCCECAVCAKHRSRGISSQPANTGPAEICFALQLE